MDPNLDEAAMSSDIEVLRQRKDQLIVQLTANKSTVLHVAAQFHDNEEFVQMILNSQPSLLCHVNSKRETALHIAARNGHFNTVKVLIEHSKSLEEDLESRVQIGKEMIWMTNEHEDTALHEAVRNNRLNVVEMLVKEDAVSPQVVNNFGESPLYVAAEKGSHSHAIVSTILEVCKSPADSGPDGRTALHAAVIAGCPECTKKILEKKPELLNKTDFDGWTPLHYAAKEGHTDTMKELLSHSPDCWEIVNAKEQNILHIANEHEKEGNTRFNQSATSKEDHNRTRDTHLVVAALIATVAFTAGLTLPGGYKSNEGPDQGTALLVRIAAFKAFVITNAIAMALSVSAIFVYLLPSDNGKPVELGEELFPGFSLIVDAMFAMIIAFMAGSYAVLSNSSDLAVGVLIIGGSVPILTSSLKRHGTGPAMRKVRRMSYSCIGKVLGRSP